MQLRASPFALYAGRHPAKRAHSRRQDQNRQYRRTGLVSGSRRQALAREVIRRRTRVAVSDAGTTRRIRHGCRGAHVDEQGHDGAQHVHLLARADATAEDAAGPLESALPPVGPASALADRCLRRGLQDRHDCVVGEGRKLGSLGHPSVVVALEAEHVGRACQVFLAGHLVGDVVGEEDVDRGVQEVCDSLFPDIAFGLGNC